MEIRKKPLFNENGDIEVSKKKMINGNTTNLNDFNNMKYKWASDWYRQAMNNFWIPEEINLSQDLKDYGSGIWKELLYHTLSLKILFGIKHQIMMRNGYLC